MGYRPAPSNITRTFDVTVSNDVVLVDGSNNTSIDFSDNGVYLFRQTDDSNANKLFTLTRWSNPLTPYTDGLVLMGDPGQSDSYLYYEASGNVGDLVYDFQSISGNTYTLRYPIEISSESIIMSYGDVFGFTMTNQSDVSLAYEISGSYFDFSGDTLSGTVAAGASLGMTKTLNAYGQIRLLLHNKEYFRRFVPVYNYAVTVSGDKFYLDGVEASSRYNTQSGVYLFDQSHVSNAGKALSFTTNATDDGTATEYTTTVEHIGTPGYANAYTVLERDADLGTLYYYNTDVSGMGSKFVVASIEKTFKVSTVVNDVGNTVFSVYDETDQVYYAQEDIPLEGQKMYYFDVSDPSNNGFELTFGTGVDTSPIPDTHVIRSSASPGTPGANIYLDLLDYYFPLVVVSDISLGVFGQALGGVPFTVTFTNGLNGATFEVKDGNGVAVTLTSPASNTVAMGLSTVEITMPNSVATGTYSIGGSNGTDVSFAFTSIAQTFVVTVGQSNGSDVFLVDGGQNVDLGLVSGNAYLFDLSYSENSYEFGLATNYDASGGTGYTTGLTYGAPYLFLESAPATTLYYYEKSDTASNPDMGNRLRQWTKQGLDISGTSALFTVPDQSKPHYVGQHSKVTPDGNTVVSISDYLVCIFDWSGNEWKLRDYFYNYSESVQWNQFSTRSSVAISDDGTYFAYSSVATGDNAYRGGSVYIHTDWNGTGWANEYTIDGNGWFGHGNIEFTSNKELLISEPTSDADDNGKVYVYELSGGTWVIRGGDTKYITQNDYTRGEFGLGADITSDGKTVVGSTRNNVSSVVTEQNDGFFIVHDWDDSSSSWIQRGSLKIVDETNKGEYVGYLCKISNDGNMVAVWTYERDYLRIFYWNDTDWVITYFDNNGNNDGLPIDTSVFTPQNSAVTANGACFYNDGAKVALKGIWNSAYNIYFYAFNTSNNTWVLESTSPIFLLDDGTTKLGSHTSTRIINISNDGNTLCIGNRTAYLNNGAMQVYKYM